MACICVIVPVYKVEDFLSRCVDSILAQSFSDFELILVDDGSPDQCGAICDAYAARDSRIHVIHQKNGGLSAARNAGIDWAFSSSDSQWLAFVDSDDWVHPAFLETLWQAAQQTGCRLSACGFFRTSGEPFPEGEEPGVQVLPAGEYYCGSFHGGVTAVAWNKLYHRSLFENLRYPVGKLHEDEFTTYQAVYQAGQVAVTERPLYAYYQNPNGIMGSKWNPRRMDVLQAFARQMIFAREMGEAALGQKAAKQNVYAVHDQLSQAAPEYRGALLRLYRQALKWGREWGSFPRTWETLWAYEEAYPCKLFWWLVFRLKGEGRA